MSAARGALSRMLGHDDADAAVDQKKVDERRPFVAAPGEWGWAAGWLFSMALTGLEFYPAYLILMILLVHKWRTNRYDFLVMATLMFGGFRFLDPEQLPAMKIYDIALVVCFAGIFLLKMNKVTKRVTWLILAYIAVVWLFAMLSEEVMSVQIRRMRYTWLVIYCLFPLLVFANREFDIMEMFRKMMIYCIVIYVLYFIDGVILSGFFFIPLGSFGDWYGEGHSTLAHPWIDLFAFNVPRISATPIIFTCIIIYPVAKFFNLQRWQWVAFWVANLVSRTMSILAGFIVTYLCFRGLGKKVAIVIIIGLLALPGVYYVDKATGEWLRVATTVDQFIAIKDGNVPEEELAEFMSGRMAQVIPKMDLLYSMNRQWIGFGFIHPKYSKSRKYFIKNELYVDVSQSEEVATAVEIAQVQTILDTGYLGLIAQTIFFILFYLAVRKEEYANYYLSVLVMVSIGGIGGMCGLNQPNGLLPVGLALGVVLLANRDRHKKLAQEGAKR
ncbi:MAG: hypothetical protein LUC85_00445 [Bacteroidales bacterium]|nr:hypothetical protein [Bacteroidales bacterium]